MSDVTYKSIRETENENMLINKIAHIYCKYVNPDCKGPVDVQYTSEPIGGGKTVFEIIHNGERVAFYAMFQNYYADILRGNKEIKISSKFYTTLPEKVK